MSNGEFWPEEEVRKYTTEMRGVTVTVNFTVEGKQKILCLDNFEKLLRKAYRIAIIDCECRTRVKRCNAPIDTCIYMNEGADEQIEKGRGKEVSLKQALDAIRRAHEAGLIHVTYYDIGGKEPQYICSCCSCCCHSFAAMQKFGFSDYVISSEMIAALDDDKCDDCGLCVDKCHFKARSMVDGCLRYEKEKCFGCGVCVPACPNDAISMKNRPD
ncbi:MAG: 4Fe-4S binding protein [Thermoplasmata archaeon]|nr:4Fe-4S binding protein [Thermoplasmata archaeon]